MTAEEYAEKWKELDAATKRAEKELQRLSLRRTDTWFVARALCLITEMLQAVALSSEIAADSASHIEPRMRHKNPCA